MCDRILGSAVTMSLHRESATSTFRHHVYSFRRVSSHRDWGFLFHIKPLVLRLLNLQPPPHTFTLNNIFKMTSTRVPLIFGTMTFGVAGKMGVRTSDLAECQKILDIYFAHGGRELDTARLYGERTTEEVWYPLSQEVYELKLIFLFNSISRNLTCAGQVLIPSKYFFNLLGWPFNLFGLKSLAVDSRRPLSR